MSTETTSSRKIAKKVRQQYNRDIRELAKRNVHGIADAFRPRPKYIPHFLWTKIVNRVVDLSVLMRLK